MSQDAACQTFALPAEAEHVANLEVLMNLGSQAMQGVEGEIAMLMAEQFQICCHAVTEACMQRFLKLYSQMLCQQFSVDMPHDVRNAESFSSEREESLPSSPANVSPQAKGPSQIQGSKYKDPANGPLETNGQSQIHWTISNGVWKCVRPGASNCLEVSVAERSFSAATSSQGNVSPGKIHQLPTASEAFAEALSNNRSFVSSIVSSCSQSTLSSRTSVSRSSRSASLSPRKHGSHKIGSQTAKSKKLQRNEQSEISSQSQKTEVAFGPAWAIGQRGAIGARRIGRHVASASQDDMSEPDGESQSESSRRTCSSNSCNEPAADLRHLAQAMYQNGHGAREVWTLQARLQQRLREQRLREARAAKAKHHQAVDTGYGSDEGAIKGGDALNDDWWSDYDYDDILDALTMTGGGDTPTADDLKDQ